MNTFDTSLMGGTMTRTRALLLALTLSLPALRAGAESQDLSWDAVEPTRQDVFYAEVAVDATEADVQAFLDERAAAATPPELGISVAPSLLDWLDAADALQTTDVVPMLAEQPPLELNVDVVNFSLQGGDTLDEVCYFAQWQHEAIEAVNDAMKNGIFVVQAAGNNGNGYSGDYCSVTNPGGASGAFVVGQLDRLDSPDLDQAEIWNDPQCTGPRPGDFEILPECGSARGGDPYGRPLLKVVTPGGRAVEPADYEDRARDDLDGPSLADDIY